MGDARKLRQPLLCKSRQAVRDAALTEIPDNYGDPLLPMVSPGGFPQGSPEEIWPLASLVVTVFPSDHC